MKEDIRISASVCTSKFEYLKDKDRWENYAERTLKQEVGNLIKKYKSTFIETDHMIERRIDLYVASPDLFWKIVNKRAEEIAWKFLDYNK